MESSSKPKKGRTKVILIVGAVIVVLALVSIYFLTMQNDDNEQGVEELQVGDYMRYQYSGLVNGTMWMNVTSANSTAYVFSTYLIHDGIVETPDPVTVNRSEAIYWGPGGPNGTELAQMFVGTEDLHTELGTRSVNHYRNETLFVTNDIYLGKDNHVIYRTSFTYASGGDISIDLVGTNVEWL